MITFTTERLLLRPYEETDFEAVHAYGSDPIVSRYMLWGPNSEEDTRNFIGLTKRHWQEQPLRSYDFAIVSRSGHQLMGGCGLYIRSDDHKEGEIGYCLNPEYWGKGIMPEAVLALLELGFERLSLHRIFATCDPANRQSYRVMEKVGMTREGHLREWRRVKGEWRDFLLYSLLEREWRER